MHIAYLYSRYPVTSQTFCDTEMLALEQLGFSFEIGSIHPPLTSLRHEHAARLKAPVHYAPPQQILRIWEHKAKAKRRWPAELVEAHDKKYGIAFKASQRARNALFFADLFVRHNVDHCHVHFANRAAHTALFVKAISGIPFSVSAHGQDFMADLGDDRLLREIFQEAEFVAAETDYSHDSLAKRCPDSATKIHRVYNGMDLGNFPRRIPHESAACAVRILSVGRLVEFKGFEYLIAACAELNRRGLGFRCEIIGDGPLRESLQMKIDEARLSEQVVLRGSLSQERVFRALKSCDIFVLASVIDRAGASDVFPTVILEAMASGKPVVSTVVAGIPESVTHQETGILVPPNNTLALADALECLIRNPVLRNDYGRTGRAHVEQHFQSDATVAPLAELFRKQADLPCSSGSIAESRPEVRLIAYLIDRWPAPHLSLLKNELREMERRNVAIIPFVCEVDESARLSSSIQDLAPRLTFLPDAMVIEAEWHANRDLARQLEEDRASEQPRAPSALFLREARFALYLRKTLAEKKIAHVHAADSRALLCAVLLQKLMGISISAAIEAAPPIGVNLLETALRRCVGVRIGDRKLSRRLSSSYLLDTTATQRFPLHFLGKKLGLDLSGRGRFWQEWAARLIAWSGERSASTPVPPL